MKVIRFRDLPLQPAAHEDHRNPGIYKKVLCTASDFLSGKVQMVNWAVLPAGKSFRAHYHESMQELFVVVKGKVNVTINQEEAVLGRGDVVVVPPGAVHTMKNEQGRGAELLVIGIAGSPEGKTVMVKQ